MKKTTITMLFLMLFSMGAFAQNNITFSVDMSQYGGSFTQPYVSGNWSGWSGTAHMLTDADGDNIWEGTFSLPSGVAEYKFTVDDWAGQEQLTPGIPCTITTSGFTNRTINVTAADTVATVCWESCNACSAASADSVNITFQLNTANITPAASGVFLAGGGNFGNPGDNMMDDSDGDGVYTITVRKPKAFSSFYTFTNGNCPDYSCKENIVGLPCADPNNFNDRFLPGVYSDTTLTLCFGACESDGSCPSLVPDVNVTFNINMDSAPDSVRNNFTTVYVSGPFNSWGAVSNPLNDNGDGTWSVTIPLPGNLDSMEYKFQVDGWAIQEEFTPGGACTKTTGGFTNRIMALTDSIQPVFCWSECSTCLTSTRQLSVDESLFTLQPSLANHYTNLMFPDELAFAEKTVWVTNTVGQLMQSHTVQNTNQFRVETASLAPGLYFVTVKTETATLTRKMVVQH